MKLKYYYTYIIIYIDKKFYVLIKYKFLFFNSVYKCYIIHAKNKK